VKTRAALRGTIGAAVGSAAFVGMAGVAHAGWVGTLLPGAKLAAGYASVVHNSPYGGVQRVSSVQNQESYNPAANPWSLVCNTQGWVGVNYPGGTPAQIQQYSNFTGGCWIERSYSYPAMSAIDPNGTCYPNKWRSDDTGGSFVGIGNVCS